MSKFENGITGYIHGTATIHNYFPIDIKGNAHICCAHCFYHNEMTNRCALNKEIAAVEPNKFVGANCPLEMDSENNE